ncbi:zf-DHHC-domain-containing protein [Backusella circina FSU 941]|nr:zf-DHHC-domain-containing protein [Backusella circina FSU 941]
MSIVEAVPERLIVLFVVLLITFLQLTVNFVIIGPALGGFTSIESLKVLSPLNILLISIYVNYYLSCTTDPGHVPDDWEPPKAILEAEELTSMGMAGARYCKKCDCYKPPRSHHCRYCGKCILKMDHHCPWINNCVGFGNYAYFLRFIYSATLCCAYGCYLMLWRAQRIIDSRKINWFGPKPSTGEYLLVGIDLIACFMVTFLVGILSLYHSYCLIKGQSTIENSERVKTRQLITRKKIDPVEFPFDIGIYRNLCSVFGNNPLLWFLPLPSHGTGLSFVMKSKTG